MPEWVSTRDPNAVAAVVQATYAEMFPEGDPLFVSRAFSWVIQAFRGELPEYQAVDTRYHDLEHTLQGTLCFARLLGNRHRVGAQPAVPQRWFELGLLAILFHDTGYLKRREDRVGTAAKDTLVHVHRSADFAATFLRARGFAEREIRAVQNMIRCTGVDARPSVLSFQDELERLVGCALGTADLLGQMAAEDYLEKLPALYGEFAEAAQHTRDPHSFVASFRSAEELLARTPAFWEAYVKPRLEDEFLGLYRFLNDPYPDGPNPYVMRIEAHMERLRRRFGAAEDPGPGPRG